MNKCLASAGLVAASIALAGCTIVLPGGGAAGPTGAPAPLLPPASTDGLQDAIAACDKIYATAISKDIASVVALSELSTAFTSAAVIAAQTPRLSSFATDFERISAGYRDLEYLSTTSAPDADKEYAAQTVISDQFVVAGRFSAKCNEFIQLAG